MNMDAVLVHDTEGLADDWPALDNSEAFDSEVFGFFSV